MSLMLPFNLQFTASEILQVICLYDPQPPLQATTNADFTQTITSDAYLNRIPQVASAGFPASVNPGTVALTPSSMPTLGPNNIPIPANAYEACLPSYVYGTSPTADLYTVLLINTALAQIEPGFSRIRVDYQYQDTTQDPVATVSTFEYFDCPFYEGFDITARELNNLVGYIESGVNFLQGEINSLSNKVQYALTRELWRGTSVSGQITTSGAITVGLETGVISESHGFHLQGCETCNNLMLKSLDEAVMDSKGVSTIPSNYSVSNPTQPCNISDFSTVINSNNATGKTSQGPYTYSFWGNTGATGSNFTSVSIITENIDGTLTYFMTSTAVVRPAEAMDSTHIPNSYTYNNANVYSNNYTNYVSGPVNSDAGSTGAAYNTEFNIATSLYNLTHSKYLAAGCLNALNPPNQDGTPVQNIVSIGTFNLTTNGNTLPWVRIVTQPPSLGTIAFNAGSTSNKIAPVNMVYDSRFEGNSTTWTNFGLNGSSGPSNSTTNGNCGYCNPPAGNGNQANFRGDMAIYANRFGTNSPGAPHNNNLIFAYSQPMDVVEGVSYSYYAFSNSTGGFSGGTEGQGKGCGLINAANPTLSGSYGAMPNLIVYTQAPDNKSGDFGGTWVAPANMQVRFLIAVNIYGTPYQGGTIGGLNINGQQNNANYYLIGNPHFEESGTYSGYVSGPINQIIHQGAAPGPPLTLNGPTNSIPTIAYVSVTPGTATSTTNLCPGGTYTVDGTNISSSYPLYLGNLQTPCNAKFDGGGSYTSFTVPSGAPQGANKLFFSNTTKQSNSYPVNILGLPTITSITPNSNQSAGAQITIIGSGFGNYVANSSFVAFYNGGYYGTTQSWTDTQIVVTVPDIKGEGAPVSYPTNTTITVYSAQCSGKASHAFTIYSDQADTISITPLVANVDINATQQFTATLNNPNFNTSQNITNMAGSGTTWGLYAIEGSQIVNIGNGNSTYGTITNTGLYTAPNTSPPNQTPSHAVVYPFCIFDADDENGTAVNTQGIAAVLVDLSASLVINPQNTSVQVPGTTQFTAIFTENGTSTNVSDEVIWYVNGIQGGNTVNGTIDNTGLYATPVIPPPTNPAVIEASYYLVNNSTTYTSTTTLNVIKQPATQIVLNVSSQINIYLGDGRFGYIPTGTNLTCNLNEYVYVQFAEQIIQNTRLPDPTYNPVQQLTMMTVNAMDSSVSQVMYNTTNAVIQPNGNTLTARTVVLGIIDPSDGAFHSMWDIANPPPVPADQEHGMSISVEGADKIRAFDANHSFKGSIMDYVNDLTHGAQQHLDIMMNQANIMLVGAATYDIASNTLTIVKPLRILGISQEKTYGVIGIIPEQQLKVQPNEYVYIDSEQHLKVGKFSDAFSSTNPDIIILGAVLDNFYTTWPLIEGLEADSSGVKNLGDTSWLKVGPLLIQWGTSDQYSIAKKDSLVTDKITFPVVYEKSCTVMVSPTETNGSFPVVQTNDTTLESFDCRIMNNQSVAIQTKISWLSIGV